MDNLLAGLLLILTLTTIFQDSLCSSDTYSAVVVEYSPIQDPATNGATNIINNVKRIVNITNIANDQFQADIIVFPEVGLKGYGNQEYYLFVPDPQDKERPCATNTSYEAPLVQLSCIARATQTYLVVNLGEKFYNTSQQKTVFFNTDVVFDSNGTIIARYRKIHLFEESEKSPSPNKELVYFDTDFGVRFGIFTCFDIIFEDPGVILANVFNITHFIFPTAWFSQLPFLTAVQEQYYWSYTQDAVLLASGYNNPSVGSSGTGIYLGRRGLAVYNMTQTMKTFMLHANVPKSIRSGVGRKDAQTGEIRFQEESNEIAGNFKEEPLYSMKMKQEGDLKMFKTSRLTPPNLSIHGFDGKSFSVPFMVRELICQNSLCCEFTLNITAVFSKTPEKINRADDYSTLYYRIAVFDGVRDYDKMAQGGIQTCAIISCVNSDMSSCGLKSDNSSAQPNMIYGFYQTDFIFNSIAINGNFSNHRSSVGPNILLTGEGDSFGSLLLPENFNFVEAPFSLNRTQTRSLEILKPIPNLVTASLYGRLFSRDGMPAAPSSAKNVCSSFVIVILLTICINSFFSYLC